MGQEICLQQRLYKIENYITNSQFVYCGNQHGKQNSDNPKISF